MLQPLCAELQVPFLSFHGQISDSTIYHLAEYICALDCQRVHCLYYGDCDPSGLVIDRAVFGDKLERMLDGFFSYDGKPNCLHMHRHYPGGSA